MIFFRGCPIKGQLYSFTLNGNSLKIDWYFVNGLKKGISPHSISLFICKIVEELLCVNILSRILSDTVA